MHGSQFLLNTLNLKIKPRMLRRNKFLHVKFLRANYGRHEPLNAFIRNYNYLHHYIGFHVNIQSLQHKLYRLICVFIIICKLIFNTSTKILQKQKMKNCKALCKTFVYIEGN